MWGKAYVTHADVLDEVGRKAHALLDLLEDGVHQVLDGGVLEAALLALAERRPDRERDDDIVGVLGRTVWMMRAALVLFLSLAGGG